MPDIVIKELKEQLVAAQAHNKILRDALRTLSNHYPDAETLAECERVRDMVDTALAQPTDDTAMNQLLAEGQAREKVLRNRLDYLANNLGEYAGAMQTQQQADVLTNYSDAAFEMLSLPSDDTALRAALANERFRIADWFYREGYLVKARDVPNAIRALGDE